MKHQHISAVFLALFSAAAGYSQIPLNGSPSRSVGQAQLALTTTNPNLVEGREFFSPQGIALDTDANPAILYVADTGNNRIMAWKNATRFNNGAPADLIIGQRDRFSTFGQGPGTSFSVGLSSPSAVAVRRGALYVADAGNNRILRFPSPFSQSDIFPDLVIGQPNFTSKGANYNTSQVNDKGFNLSGSRAAITFDAQGNLWVTDGGNRRVLRYRAADVAGNNTGFSADLEIGQIDFTSVAAALGTGQIGSFLTKDRFGTPACVSFDAQGNLYVCDRDLGRVLVFSPPFASGMLAARVMGVVIPPSQGTPPQAILDRTAFSSPYGVISLPGTVGIAVLDAGSNRILTFDRPSQWPAEDSTKPEGFSPQAKSVFGHTDFNNRTANNGQPAPSSTSLSLPVAAVLFNNEVYLADAGNHRVLVLPYDSAGFGAATRVLGQDRFESGSPNLVEGREFQFVAASSRGAVADAGILVDARSDPPHLFVADSFNNRILGFRDLRRVRPGDKADLVIGQPDLVTTMCNYPTNDADRPNQSGLCHPVGLAVDNAGNLYVADSGNGRVLRFPDPFARGGTLPQADLVLGQANFTTKITDPTPRTMSSPYGLAFAGDNGLVVSDQVHNRVLFFPRTGGNFTNGQAASKVMGQPDFFGSGTTGDDNRMRQPQHVSTDTDSRIYVADLGNNRVLIFDAIVNLPNSDAHAAAILGNLNSPSGVYVSPRTGEIWVTNTNSGSSLRYARFDQLGINNTPTFTIQDQVPTLALVQDQFGDLFVADASNRVAIHFPGLQPLNGATFLDNRPVLAPGVVGTIKPVGQQFGSDTANFADLPNPLPLPRTLADIQVLVNDDPAPLYFVSPGQINFQMPITAPPNGTVDVTIVRRSTGQILGTSPVQMNVASPGIFLLSYNGNQRQAAVLNQDGSVNSPTNAAARGSVISIFATGQGAVPNPPPDGTAPSGLVSTTEKPRVIIGTCFTDDCGEPDDGISYSGLAPGLVGVWQINVRVPLRTAPDPRTPIALLYKSISSQDPNVFRAVFAVKDK